MKISVRPVPFLLLLLLSAAQVYSFDDMNRQIGIIYLRNSAVFYLNGRYDEAGGYLEKTREFYTTSSDYHYLSGLLKYEADNNLPAAADYFKRALKEDNWLLLDRKECVTDLARILFRMKDYSGVISMVENGAYPDFNDNDLMYLYLLSLKYGGNHDKYRSILSGTMVRYPDDYRFGMLYVKEDRRYRDRLIDGDVEYRNAEGYADTIYEAIMMLEDDRKLSAFRSYFDAGGKSIRARIEYYRLRGGISSSELDALLEQKFFEDPGNRLRLKEILPLNELRKKLDDAYNSYTGNIYYDLNEDGYFEELHLFDAGKPVGISIDQNQDGNIEVMMIFDDGNPSELIISDYELITITYDSYPAVKEISIAEGSMKKVYTLLKDRVDIEAFVRRESDDKIIYLADNVESITDNRDALSAESVRVSEYTGGASKDNYDYLRKELERQDEKYSILKIYNEIIGNYVYRLYDDRKTEGFADLDYDNLIDIHERYEDGRLVSIEADDNKNGKYDFQLTFDGEQTVSWWDFNEDGVYDCRQYRKNGILVKEFSSALDGNFDIIERN